MSKSNFIRLSGWAFMLGALALLFSFMSGSAAGFFATSILLAIGMLGLRTRYGEKAGNFGKNMLLAGVIGMVLTYVAIPIFGQVEVLYLLPYAGPAVLLGGLTISGIAALSKKPLSNFNWLPTFAGLAYPLIFFPIFFYVLMNNGEWPPESFPYTVIQIILLVQTVALLLLGAILQTDVTKETVPA